MAHFFPLELEGTFGAFDEFSALHAVRLYADPGAATVTVRIFRSNSTGSGTGHNLRNPHGRTSGNAR